MSLRAAYKTLGMLGLGAAGVGLAGAGVYGTDQGVKLIKREMHNRKMRDLYRQAEGYEAENYVREQLFNGGGLDYGPTDRKLALARLSSGAADMVASAYYPGATGLVMQ